jgi:hypothetical protein
MRNVGLPNAFKALSLQTRLWSWTVAAQTARLISPKKWALKFTAMMIGKVLPFNEIDF